MSEKSLGKKLGLFKILIIAKKAGRVTRKYPFEKPLVTDEFRGKIEIDEKECIGCGACANACPPNALKLIKGENTFILQYFIGRCIYCWRCIDVCPTNAIKGTREFELATPDLNDLYESVVHDVIKCRECSKPIMTVKAKDYIISKVSVSENYIDLDPDCRKKHFLSSIEKRFSGGIE